MTSVGICQLDDVRYGAGQGMDLRPKSDGESGHISPVIYFRPISFFGFHLCPAGAGPGPQALMVEAQAAGQQWQKQKP